jgi:hypothetical protein
MKRRPLIFAALVLSLSLASAHAAERLPLRNLLVEVRQGDESQLRTQGGGIQQGAVVVGPNGEVLARGGVTFEARGRSDARSTSQQVSVLNGGRAAVRIGESVPMQWLQWAWTPRGPVVVAETGFVETGRGFVVQPRWPGGEAPVSVEVHTEASDRASGGMPSRHAPDGQLLPEGSLQQAGVLTTVQLPLGEWVTVARSGDTQTSHERGVLSSRDAQGQRGFVLQMRVTAP